LEKRKCIKWLGKEKDQQRKVIDKTPKRNNTPALTFEAAGGAAPLNGPFEARTGLDLEAKEREKSKRRKKGESRFEETRS